MPGSVTHRYIAHLLAERLIQADTNPKIVSAVSEHKAELYAGSYQGADIQILPASQCPDCGVSKSLDYDPTSSCCEKCGKSLEPFTIDICGKAWTKNSLHKTFYGMTHVLFANEENGRENLTWDEMILLFTLVFNDIKSARGVAFAIGWLSHIVTDCFFKDMIPNSLDFKLIDGKYGEKSKIVMEYLILTKLAEDASISQAELLYGLPEWNDDGVMTHYMMLDDPETYSHWPEKLLQKRPVASHWYTTISELRKQNAKYYLYPELTSQFVAGQISLYPPEQRVSLDDLSEFSINGLKRKDLLGLVVSPGSLCDAFDKIVSELLIIINK